MFYEPRYRLCLLAEAERIAWSIPLWHHRMPVLRGLVEVLAEEDPAEAERIARTVAKPDLQASLLSAIAGRCTSRAERPEKLLTAVEALACARRSRSPPGTGSCAIWRHGRPCTTGGRPSGSSATSRSRTRGRTRCATSPRPDGTRNGRKDFCWRPRSSSPRSPTRPRGFGRPAGWPARSCRTTRGRRGSCWPTPSAAARADDAALGGGWDGDLPPLNGRLTAIAEEAERLVHAIGSAEQQASALVDIAAALTRYDAPPVHREAAGGRPRGQEREPLNA